MGAAPCPSVGGGLKVVTSHQTFCRNCTHRCGLLVTIENDRILEVKGDRAHPITEGYFCLKTLANAELHGGGDGRLVHSVKRCADGMFAPVDADAAINVETINRMPIQTGFAVSITRCADLEVTA